MKKLFIILLLEVLAINFSDAQTLTTEDAVYRQVDKPAEFTGGPTKMWRYIIENLKYPEEAVKANITGKVWAQLIIEKDGGINNVSILKGIGFGCDEEVVRIVKAMPKWSAGMKDGKAVRTSYVLPVMFAMDSKKSK